LKQHHFSVLELNLYFAIHIPDIYLRRTTYWTEQIPLEGY
jgi:hypothetical protein